MPRGVKKGSKRGFYKSGGRGSRGGKGWNYGIPDFHVTNNFVYAIDSLLEPRDSPAWLYEKRKMLARDADYAANQIGATISISDDSTISNLNSAVEFLKSAADSQRASEVQILKSYAKKIQQHFPDNRQILEIAEKLQTLKLDETDSQELEDLYLDLIKAINYVKQGYKQTSQRLELFIRHLQSGSYDSLYKDDMRFRGEQDIRSLLSQVIGTDTKRIGNSFSNLFSNAIKKYTFSPKGLIVLGGRGGSETLGLLAAIAGDIQQDLQEILLDRGMKDFSEFTQEQIEEVVKKYFEEIENGTERTSLQKGLAGDQKRLDWILESAIKTYGISELETERQKALRARQLNYRKKRDKNDPRGMMNIYKKIGNNDLYNALTNLKINVKTNTSHGNFEEFLTALIEKGINGGGGKQSQATGATDTYSIGSALVDFGDFMPFVRQYIDMLDKRIMESEMVKRSGAEDKEHQEMLEQLRESAMEAYTDLEHQAKLLYDYENGTDYKFFVYHESEKLYKSMEVGKNYKGFHGREMIILDYIDTLYGAGISNGILPPREELYFLALNIADGAAAAGRKKDLETYLSVFAGLIMFGDDLNVIAQEAMSDTTYSADNRNVENIHLYRLNTIYVPSSMILSYTYRNMAELLKLIDTADEDKRYGAKAEINNSAADKTIDDLEEWTRQKGYLSYDEPYSHKWKEVADDVSSGTKVRIAFLSSFITLMKRLAGIQQ